MKIKEQIINVCLKIAKRNEGALVILGNLDPSFYIPMVEQVVSKFNIEDNPKLLESLALMDGAVIISPSGEMVAYGVSIKSNQVFKNMGTRHSAGLSASLNNVTSFVVSAEDKKIRVFEGGKVIMQIDTLEKGVEKRSSEITDLLESLGAGALGVIGGSALGIVGIALMPGVIVFGGVYWMIKKLLNKGNGRDLI